MFSLAGTNTLGRQSLATKVAMAFIAMIAAVAMMGFAANTAKAAPVVAESVPGTPCPALFGPTPVSPLTPVSGGCTIGVTGTGIVLSINGTAAASCDNSFTVHIGPDGETWITNISITPGTAGCAAITECNVDDRPGPIAWHDQITWRDPPGIYVDTIELCLDTPDGRKQGNLEVEVVTDPVTGQVLGVTANNAPISGTNAAISGAWGISSGSLYLTH